MSPLAEPPTPVVVVEDDDESEPAKWPPSVASCSETWKPKSLIFDGIVMASSIYY
jgi:hypothetical protein